MPRIKSFDPDVVLDRAVEQFWRAGYDGTSMTMLLAAMGISRQSLYDTFGDKRSLFLSALARYREMVKLELERRFGSPGSPTANIRGVFEWVSEVVLQDPAHRSCFMANSSLELGQRDPDVRAHVNAHLRDVEDLFCDALEQARDLGELQPGREPRSLARFLTTAIHGLGVMARGGADAPVLRDSIDTTLWALG